MFDDGDDKYNVYTWDDNVFGSSTKGPRLWVNYDNSGRLVSQAIDDTTHFILNAVATPWFDVAPNNAITIAPSTVDSTIVFNSIKDYFTTIASINEKAVPYLKYVTVAGSGNFRVDSVRADMVDFYGLQMRASPAYLDGIGIHMSATYDNKGTNDISSAPTDAHNYVDAFTNLIELFNHYVHNESLPSFYNMLDLECCATVSGISEYIQYVADFYNSNATNDLNGYKKSFSTYTTREFSKYTNVSDEGKALANWMDACEKYFGVEGFAGIGEKVFFIVETFTDPENIAVFQGIPTYTVDEKKGVTGIVGRVDVVNPWTSQYAFVAKSICQNLIEWESSYTAKDYTGWDSSTNSGGSNSDLVMKSLVFELLEANYLVDFANNTKSLREIWTELGDVLTQVKADLDAVTAE